MSIETTLQQIDTATPTMALEQGSTLDNLQAAYNGESNAGAKYAAYAQKADEEGYGAVASLFRAASQAEAVHAANHAEVIKEMGGTPQADIKKVEPKSTRENLIDAYAGETYERFRMYPAYCDQARSEKNTRPLRTFNYARTAEDGHAKLYKEALLNLDNLKDSANADYYVCPICGWTVTADEFNFKKCPHCPAGADTFRKVT
jgi:rubrerythrin